MIIHSLLFQALLGLYRLGSKPTGWDGDSQMLFEIIRWCISSKPTGWDGDPAWVKSIYFRSFEF